VATYSEWNQALIDFAVQGIPRGKYVFLSIDEDTLESIGLSFEIESPADGWVSDFKQAVRFHCTSRGKITLKRITSPLRDPEDRPRYAGFLAAMVLAAHYMGEDEDTGIHETDYFTHLNRVFDLDENTSRAGLDSGEEIHLWEDWQRWVRSRGLLPSLQAGQGKYKYIGYPISQALLRQSDKDKLWQQFTDRSWSRYLDEDTVMAHLRVSRKYLTRHLQDLLNTDDPRGLQVYDTLSRACYDVYEAWVESGGSSRRKPSRIQRVQRVIRCGLLRQVDYFIGTTEYYLFPRQPAGIQLHDAEVEYQEETYPLFEDRPGWFAPLWEIDEHQLEEIDAPLNTRHPTLRSLQLPKRDYWILTADPETPESDVFATWRSSPVLGEPFVLLCRKSLGPTIQRLKVEGFLDFDTQPKPMWNNWLEYENVFIMSEPRAWESITIENTTLLEALQPRSSFKLSLTGGLRAPGMGAWIVGHGPGISVSAFHSEIQIEIVEPESGTTLIEETIEAGKVLDFSWDQTGSFIVSAGQGHHVEEQLVRIVSWDELHTAPPPQHIPEEISQKIVFGAKVQKEI
jgi:hypothetical protein